MKMTSYKPCAVPMCKSTTIKCPDKLFIHVPLCPKRRKQWLQLARRDLEFTSDKSTIYFCEDHFDLPNDMENYIRYCVMGSVSKIQMKPDCLPSKFQFQSDRVKHTAPPQPRSDVSKRRRMDVIQEIHTEETEIPATSGHSGMTSNSGFLSTIEKNDCSNFQDQATQVCSEVTTKSTQICPAVTNKLTQICPEVTNKLIHACLSAKIRSKYVQTSNQARDKNTSPLKPYIKTTATSPFKTKPGLAGNTKMKKNFMLTKNLDLSSSNSSSPSEHVQLNTDTSPSVQSLSLHTMTSTSSDQSELSEIRRKIEAERLCQMSIENTARLIKNNPRYYIGISKDCYYLIDILKNRTKLPEEHILLCLKKIRLNTPFSELGDQFGMSLSYASKIFKKSVPVIESVLRPFIIKSNKRSVIRNLPMAFRHKYHNIYCIIDCLEIEIQKPSKAVEQALSWSAYKKANTAKYLISSTPDGIINYISPGYSGRITDVLLVQNCSFLDCLEPGVSILADRGFKHIEELLLQKSINLLRPPSVAYNSKLSKQDVIKTKQIASLRIHIERIIRRLREFSMLKPHSVVNKKLLNYLDECIIIACALINLQDSIIKNT